MTFVSILETVFIGPLKLIFEIIFQGGNKIINNPAISIILLSLLMNVLVLPLYKRADAMQEQARDTEAKLHDGVAHIKKTFSGDERMMILQAYYRQNNYKPTDVLQGSVSLLLEIPFFMAAYQFLSHLQILNGVSFGPIKDLGKPDGLIVIAGVAINLLPVLMTLINFISSALYLKGFPLKTKLQLYGMALFFLVFLYKSPAGLVFYWTLNNLFSLAKNIFYKLKNPKKILKILMSTVGIAALVLSFFTGETAVPKKRILLIVIGVLLQLPTVIALIKFKIKIKSGQETPAPNKKIFVSGALFLTVFIGVLIPSNYIAASPQEYVDVTYFLNPLWYVVSALAFSVGLFLVWMGVFYWLASPKGKVIFERVIWVMCGCAVVNYMFFGTKLGVLSPALTYEEGFRFAALEYVVNLLVIIAVTMFLYIAAVKWSRFVKPVLLTATVAFVVMSGINVFTINKSIGEIKSNAISSTDHSENMPNFQLSKEGNNVVVIVLDRAMGEYVPYLLKEKPELKDMFEGFTYYSNTISHGGHTNMGMPALMGGYEYTPVEMNKRDDELLVDKHNESLKVMPELFWKNGYNVTVCDVPYANYSWVPDLSIYDEYEGMQKYITKGYFGTKEMKESVIENNKRNFFCFSVMKTMPLFVQQGIYSGGDYNQAASADNFTAQVRASKSKSTGMSTAFMEAYLTLQNLDTMTKVTESDADNFLFLYNDLTHEPMLLSAPEYVPEKYVDNTEYDNANKDRFSADGKTIDITKKKQMIHYQTNMAALLKLGEWFDYLKENDVYDNTKIIIVSDHGYYLYQSEELIHDDLDMSAFFPLMLVKDFNSTGSLETSDEFMTNADVPTIAFEGTIKNPVNPFTGNPINNDEKYAHDQFVITSRDWKLEKNSGKTFNAATWAAISDNIWDRSDWKFIDDSVVLKKHKTP